MTAVREKRIGYYYDEEIGNFCYGGGNPMRPHRARMVYSLLKAYGLTNNLIVHRPEPRSFDQLTEFHADDYIDFLRIVTPNNAEEHMNQLRRFNMGQIGDVDCPVFDGVYEYCAMYASGSVGGASLLANGQADICFNWSGGMHHAKKAEASGFCYVNDIVLAILELLKAFQRVLYVDIDIHHGDGVEEAFYLTDRVMTVSFHKYGEFFPGTGALDDIGYGKGKFYTVNVPLKDGMDDDNYKMLYEPIMAKVMEMYQPEAIVMCCGADSLSGDKLGCFNLSMEGHSHCIEFLARYNVPLLVLGGGGYTLRNVARCWCYETGRLMGQDLPDKLPDSALNEYNYYLDTGALRIAVSNMKNMNTREELEDIKRRVLEHLSQLPPVPSTQMAHQPGLHQPGELPEEDPDVRGGGQVHEERRRVRAGDESDGEEEGNAGRRTRTDAAAAVAENGNTGGDGAGRQQGGGALQPATLATSEALNGPGRGGAAPMEVDAAPADGQAAAAAGNGVARAGAGGTTGVGSSHAPGAQPHAFKGPAPGATVFTPAAAAAATTGTGAATAAPAAPKPSVPASAPSAQGAAAPAAPAQAPAPPSSAAAGSNGAAAAGAQQPAANISILGPSASSFTSLLNSNSPPRQAEMPGSRPHIVGASIPAEGGAAAMDSKPAAEGGIYRPQG